MADDNISGAGGGGGGGGRRDGDSGTPGEGVRLDSEDEGSLLGDNGGGDGRLVHGEWYSIEFGSVTSINSA
jgi:hypothetical protein